MRIKHSIQVRKRAFSIWQKLGSLPWRKPKESKEKRPGDFYKGAFDSIPFLNDDAKRTFAHLLLRPGYMIKDYISGQHERYLAPLTALIIFYAFFALESSLLRPIQQEKTDILTEAAREIDEVFDQTEDLAISSKRERVADILSNTLHLFSKGYMYLHLDQHPEEVDTQHEQALAAFESTLRSQGIPLFLGQFLFLWLSMGIVLRKYGMGMSACATASAYVLCQFCFFMMFAVLLTWGRSTSISVLLMLVLLAIDYKQLLGLPTKRCVRLGIRTGIMYGLLYAFLILIISLVILTIAYFQSK